MYLLSTINAKLTLLAKGAITPPHYKLTTHNFINIRTY